jgi:CHAT domain-containing protein
MEAFYTELRENRKPADVALADAMRTIRAKPGFSDPIYWGAFRVVGTGLR